MRSDSPSCPHFVNLVLVIISGNQISFTIFRCSSVVEQPPVKRLVVGSIPTAGASKITLICKVIFCYQKSFSNFFIKENSNYSVVAVVSPLVASPNSLWKRTRKLERGTLLAKPSPKSIIRSP